MNRLLRLSALLLPVLWLAGCDEIDFGDNFDRYKEDFHYSYTLPSGGHLSIENQNGSIEISSWEKDTIDITGTKHANSQEVLKSTKIDIMPTSNSVSIRTIPPSGFRGGVGARYVIRVPKRLELDRVISSNGSIRIEGIDGNAHLKSSNGAIRTVHTHGELDARTSNGSLDIQHVGNASVHSSNGSVHVDLEKGVFEATTSNGPIVARLTDPTPNIPVRIESSNGHIEITTNVVPEIRSSTSNSSITVRIPANANARLKAHTSNSSITTDFDVLVRGGVQSKNSLEGNIGNGGPLLDLGTTNGSIKVLKF